MAPSRAWLLALAAALFPACAFILDFNELQGGSTDGGNVEASSDGGDRLDASSADASEPDPCPMGCDDEDPCTEDSCTPDGCQHVVQPGVVADGLDEVLEAEAIHRVTMTSRNDRFYLSVFKSMEGAYELDLHSFGKAGKDLSDPVRVAELEDFGGRPVSAAGLASPDTAFELTAYVAFGIAPSLPAQVHRLSFDLDLEYQESSPAASDSNYSGGRRIHPIAWQPPGATVYGAWPAQGGGIFLHTGTNTQPPGEQPQLGKEQAFALAPLSVGSLPAVAWATESGVNVQGGGQTNPSPLGQCDDRPGSFLSLTTGYTTVEGIWFVNWTKRLPSSVVSEAKPVLCQMPGFCVGRPRCSEDDTVNTGIRNSQLEFLTLQNDPAGRVYEVLAQSEIEPSANEALLTLQVIRIDLDPTMLDAGADVRAITDAPIPLAETGLGPSNEGPDWPALALLPPDRIGVSWIAPAEDGSGDELHIQRHRICFPDDD